MRRQIRSTTSSSSPRIAAIDPGFVFAASAIARPRSRTSAIASSLFIAPPAATAALAPPRPRERRKFTPRVADHEVRLDAAGLDRREHSEARRDERGLLDFGLD